MTRRWDWTYRHGRSLLVTSVVTVVILATAFVVVVTVGERDGAGCLVGSWRTVESEQHLSADIGTVILDDDGPVETYREDGTGEVDYGDGVTYRVADTPLGLADSELVISGTASYRYVVDDGTISYQGISSNLTQTNEYIELPTSLSGDPFGYRCEGDTLTFHIESRYQARALRLD